MINKKETIDLIEINSTLKQFPTLHRVIGDITHVGEINNYPYKKQGVNEPIYNFYGILNDQNKIWKISFLKELENGLITLNLFSDDMIKEGLLNNPFSFKSEIGFGLFCKTHGITILEVNPKLGSGNKLDYLVEINSQKVLIEVITPMLKLDMIKKNLTGCFPITGEIEFNIFSEFEHHQIMENLLNVPFVIAIDAIYAGIDSINVSGSIEEFRKKFEKLSPYLCGVILMNASRPSPLCKQIDNYQFFSNPNSKLSLDFEIIKNKK